MLGFDDTGRGDPLARVADELAVHSTATSRATKCGLLAGGMRETHVSEEPITLPDGRRLALHALGREDGFPVVYLHGAIGTRLDVSPELLAVIERLQLRWVCVSRPGFGGSDPRPGRTMLDFADDLRHLAAVARWRRFAVVGVSSGGPYALACGHALPDLVGAVAVSASLSPACAPHAVPGLPPGLRAGMRALARAPRTGTRVLEIPAALLAAHPTHAARVAGRRRAAAALALRDATAGGVGGLVEDYLICCRPWGFDPSEVGVEVHLWHGVRDRLVPAEHAWQLAAALPRCRASFDPDEDHFFFRRRIAEIVTPLVATARARAAR
jgi:pimeloyl-ACP methyl ester carboxylesterase